MLSLVLLLLSALMAVSESQAIGYLIQSYWYSSITCNNAPSYVEVHQVNTCIQMTSDQFIMYSYDNSSMTKNNFKVTLQYFNDILCTQASSASSTVTYQKTCTAVGKNAITAHYVEGSPTYSFSGSLTSYYSSSNCLGYPTYAYWRSNAICAPFGHTSSAVSCSSDGKSYIYKNWNHNTTCRGPPSSSQSLPVVSQCVQYFSNSYSKETCTSSDSSSAPDSKVSCFEGSMQVQVEGFGLQAIETVHVGDRVLTVSHTGVVDYSEVVAIPHGKNAVESEFIRINTMTGREISLTASHLLMARCDANPAASMISDRLDLTGVALLPADQISTGCYISTIEGLDQVISVHLSLSHGIYTVVTKADYIVVNGIVASPFAVNHAVGKVYYDVVGTLENYLPVAFMSVVREVALFFAQEVSRFL